MKFEKTTEKPFVPITITLESEDEVKVLIEMFSMTARKIADDALDHYVDEELVKRVLNKHGDNRESAYSKLKRIQEK